MIHDHRTANWHIREHRQSWGVVLHCDILRWSATVCRDLQVWLLEYGEAHPNQITMAPVIDTDDKHARFLDLMGFDQTVHLCRTENGIKPYRQLIWPFIEN